MQEKILTFLWNKIMKKEYTFVTGINQITCLERGERICQQLEQDIYWDIISVSMTSDKWHIEWLMKCGISITIQ